MTTQQEARNPTDYGGRNPEFAAATVTRHAAAARRPRNRKKYNRNDFKFARQT